MIDPIAEMRDIMRAAESLDAIATHREDVGATLDEAQVNNDVHARVAKTLGKSHEGQVRAEASVRAHLRTCMQRAIDNVHAPQMQAAWDILHVGRMHSPVSPISAAKTWMQHPERRAALASQPFLASWCAPPAAGAMADSDFVAQLGILAALARDERQAGHVGPVQQHWVDVLRLPAGQALAPHTPNRDRLPDLLLSLDPAFCVAFELRPILEGDHPQAPATIAKVELLLRYTPFTEADMHVTAALGHLAAREHAWCARTTKDWAKQAEKNSAAAWPVAWATLGLQLDPTTLWHKTALRVLARRTQPPASGVRQ